MHKIKLKNSDNMDVTPMFTSHSFDLAHFVPKPLIYLFDDFYISFTFFLLAEQFQYIKYLSKMELAK